MNYTDNKDQIVFLRDADIAASLDGHTTSGREITANGVPSFDLFKAEHDALTAYDQGLSDYLKQSVDVSVDLLEQDKNKLRAEAEALSSAICLSVDQISAFARDTISADLYELSDGVETTSALLSSQITSLWEDVKGGVNYKGHLYNFEETKINGKNLDLSGIFALKYSLYDTATWKLSADKSLNNGWLYNVTLTGDYAVSGYVTNDGITIENNDYFIIHDRELSCVDISKIARATVDIIEAVQDDYVRFALLKQISTSLSDDYVKKASALSDALSADIDKLSASLSGDIDSLSASLSTTAKLSVEKLQSQVISNDNDITFLSSSISTEVQNNLDAVHYKKDIVVNAEDHTIQTTLKRTFGDSAELKVGLLARFPSAHVMANEDSTWTYSFEENDFIVFRKDCTANDADETCFDIIKDYDKEIAREHADIVGQLNAASAFLSGSVDDVSSVVKDMISADLYKLSNELCATSSDICLSASEMSAATDALKSALDLSVTSLQSQTISNGNDILFISGEVSANDNDIASIQSYISGDNSLCASLGDLSSHYSKTFTEQSYTKGGADEKADVLNIVNSEDLAQKFILVYLSGTLVLSAK